MAFLDGFTVDEMVADVLGIVEIQGTNSDGITKALRFLNLAQLAMYGAGDIPTLKYTDATITTDGSDYYDLTDDGVIGTDLGASFGRLVDKTMRCDTRKLFDMSRGKMIAVDPDYTDGGELSGYCLVKKTQLWLYPVGSSGDTVTFDFIQLPAKLEAGMAASAISFEPQDHQLIIDGAIALAMRRYGQTGWQSVMGAWRSDLKKFPSKAKTMHRGSRSITPSF